MLRLLRNPGRDQLPTLHLMHMAVPQGLLIQGKRLKKPLADYVLHPHDFGIFGISIENDALVHLLVDNGAKMVRFDLCLYMTSCRSEIHPGRYLRRQQVPSLEGETRQPLILWFW